MNEFQSPSIDYAAVGNDSAALTIMLMFVGGSPGSTAGGVKTTTIAVLVALVGGLLITGSILFGGDQIRANGAVSRGRIGAILGSLSAERARDLGLGIVRGAIVEDVAPGSPAEGAGLRRGDIISRIQNRPVANAGSVLATVGIAPPGTRLDLTYMRGGRDMTTSLTVADPTPGPLDLGSDAVQAFGAQFRSTPDSVQVVAVEAGSPAAAQGLRAGDIVQAVGDTPVSDLVTLSQRFADGPAVTLRIERGGRTLDIVLGG